MKRSAGSLRRAAAFFLALALCLFCPACAGREEDAGRAGAASSEAAVPFAQRPYERMEMEDLEPLLAEFKDACRDPGAKERARALCGSLLDAFDQVATTAYLAQIRYDCDPLDDAAAAEQARTTQLYNQAMGRIYDSLQGGLSGPNRRALADELGPFAPVAAYSEPLSDRQAGLLEQITSLEIAYTRAISEGPSVQMDGETWTYARIWEEEDRLPQEKADAVYLALGRRENETLGALYLQLAALRRELAEETGYDSYVDYAFESVFMRDYTPQEAGSLSQSLRELLAPLWARLDDQARTDWAYGQIVPPAERSPQELLKAVGPQIRSLDPRLGELFDRLETARLYDIAPYSERSVSGYTVPLPSYSDAFIFLPTEDSYMDDMSLLHEFGHFCAYCLDETPELFQTFQVDLSELQSQGLEMLMLSRADQLFGDGAAAMRYLQLHEMASTILLGCMLQEFESAVYDNPGMTLREMNELFARLQEDYRCVQFDTDESGQCYGWVNISHLFYDPFYYLGYSTSALSSLELWVLAHDDAQRAAGLYLELLEAGPAASYRRTAADSGLRDIFDEEQLASLLEEVSRTALREGILAPSHLRAYPAA